MERVSFRELGSLDFELSDLFGMCQRWSDGCSFSLKAPRKSSGILYLQNCRRVFRTSDGRTLDAGAKSFVCLPAGSLYSAVNYSCENRGAYLVEFNINSGDKRCTFGDMPFLIEGINSYLASELMIRAVKAYESPQRSPLAVRTAVYNLLDLLSRETQNYYNRRFESIAPGIELLDSARDLSVSELAAACSVSAGCFRRLFKEYSGKTPIEYRLDLKFSRARSMLAESDTRVADIAALLGFESSAYFCRLFKRKFGITPSGFRESMKERGI